MIERLFGACHHSVINKLDNPVAEHLRVNTEVLLIQKKLCNRLGYSSYAAFNRAPVLDEPGNVLPDAAEGLVRFRYLGFNDFFIVRHQRIDGIDMQETVPE